jgi:hypothetical protein
MNPTPQRDEIAFHRPLRTAVTAVILAAVAVVLSLIHDVPTNVPAFAAVMLVLLVDAVLVWRQTRWAVLVTLAGLAGQAVAVAGTIVELARGIADVKVRQLHADHGQHRRVFGVETIRFPGQACAESRAHRVTLSDPAIPPGDHCCVLIEDPGPALRLRHLGCYAVIVTGTGRPCFTSRTARSPNG